MIETEIFTKTFEVIKWEYGFCQPAVEGIIIGVSIIISVNLTIKFLLLLRKRKNGNTRVER